MEVLQTDVSTDEEASKSILESSTTVPPFIWGVMLHQQFLLSLHNYTFEHTCLTHASRTGSILVVFSVAWQVREQTSVAWALWFSRPTQVGFQLWFTANCVLHLLIQLEVTSIKITVDMGCPCSTIQRVFTLEK